METNHNQTDTATASNQPTQTWPRQVGLVALAALLGSATPTIVTVKTDGAPAAAVAEPSTAAATPAPSHEDHQADEIADYTGGVAAQVRTHDGDDVPGDLFLLMATDGSDAKARLYDQNPYAVAARPMHPEAIESNHAAARTVKEITGHDIRTMDFTSAPGGGPSGGLTYTIAYFNVLSDGEFTGQLRVAATGELGAHGYVYPITAIDEKSAAAHLADADVLFTPSVPMTETIEAHQSRLVGELSRARNTGATLADERRWDSYSTWGTGRPSGGMDVVGVRHVGDVAAYLCGAGSTYACEVGALLADTVIDTSTSSSDPAASDAPPPAARDNAPGQVS